VQGSTSSSLEKSDLLQDDEHMLSIIHVLMQRTEGTSRERLIFKFKEKSGEKLERLIQLHEFYIEHFWNYKHQINESMDDDSSETKEQRNERVYLHCIKSGLINIMSIDSILCFLIATNDQNVS